MAKILVVEDEKAQLQLILTILKKNGFEAWGASNGVEGASMAKTHLPDLIISDVHMSEGSGYDMIALLKSDPVSATIPVIFTTAMADRENYRVGMELGADDFLPKPFTSSELLNAVNTRLEKHQAVWRKANEKLEELRKSMSIAIPHELRTPLNGILGFADILRKQFEDLDPPEVGWMADRIYKNAKRLSRLVENYLIYVDSELGKTEGNKSKYFVENEATPAAEVINEVSSERGTEYGRIADVSLEVAKAAVAIPSHYMKKVVEEIVDNAFKFSNAGSAVYVKGEIGEVGYALTVIDNGRGMSPKQVKEIGAYVQFDRSVHEQQGSGFGLAVAQKLTRLYGGNVTIQSEVGKGTTVAVTIPRA